MQSYRKEVHHIRRTKNIFWLIVFAFAWLLYFFFQGYYPSINFSFESILSASGRSRTDLIENVASIKSFGIINVSTLPNDATLLLNNKNYTNNEKRMSDYGEYHMDISKLGYLGAGLDFSIAEEKPYFIEVVHLVPTGRYSIMGFTGDSWKTIDTDLFIARSASGTSLYKAPYYTGTLLTGFSGSRWIGEKYFISGSTLMQLDTELLTFNKIAHPLASTIFKCPNPLIEGTNIFCKETRTLTLESGKTLTGVISHANNWIQTESGVLFVKNGNSFKTLNTKTTNTSHIFSYDNSWYGVESGSLIRIESNKKVNISPVGLKEIKYASVVDGNIALMGKSSSGNTLLLFNPKSELRPQMIPFPDISLEGIKLISHEGNIYIKTNKHFLFLYRGSYKVEWLVDGDILAQSNTSVLYLQDGKIWRAYFGPIE